MHFINFLSVFLLLSSIFIIISHADEKAEEDAKTSENSSSEDETENAMDDEDEATTQIAIGDFLLPKGLSLEDFESGRARNSMRPNLWKNGEVTYYMDDTVDDELRAVVLEAFGIWEKDSCLKFTEGCQDDVCVQVTTSNPKEMPYECYADVGALPDGQVLNLGAGCKTLYVAVHEVGHCVGFYHEMDRFDRDDFLFVIEQNLSPGTQSLFNKFVEDEDTDYDFTSIMQYDAAMTSTSYNVNSMVTLNPHYQNLIGQTQGPSFRDLYRLNTLYSCSSDCPNADLHCENGGYLSPYRGDGEQCFCMCPPRIEGSACEDKPEPYEYYDVPSCSQNVTEETVIETPNYPLLSNPPERCSWWIQPPEGSQVQVEFEDFSFRPKHNELCVDDRIEIRYKDLYDGDIVCGEEAKGETYTSTTGTFIIIIGGSTNPYSTEDLRGISAKVTFV